MKILTIINVARKKIIEFWKYLRKNATVREIYLFVKRSLLANLLIIPLILVFVFGLIITIPIVSRTMAHSDEYQFYFNAFTIMAGQELHNYIHVALTEYLLAGFFSFINLVTSSGVNFPQGDPSLATYFWGHWFGFILYILAYILGLIVLQKNDSKIKLRSVFFSVLYFASPGILERFIRINSDSMMVIVFLNYLIISFWLQKSKASVAKTFVINLAFLFLGSFTNLKSLFLFLPIFSITTVNSFLWSRQKHTSFSINYLYKSVLYTAGIFFGGILLWVIFMPKPFDYIRFWYGVKKATVHSTQFDFDYPSQSFGSWKVYIYDFFAEYLGLSALVAVVLVLLLFILVKKNDLRKIFNKMLQKVNIRSIFEGDLYPYTGLVLALSLVFYYLGVSMRVVHWSRWGVPIGFLGIMLLSMVLEKAVLILDPLKRWSLKKVLFGFLGIFLITTSLRVLITVDMIRTDFPEKGNFPLTYIDTEKLASDLGIAKEEMIQKMMWFTGYTPKTIGSDSLEKITEEKNKDVRYVLWPYWNIGLVYTTKNVDLGTHNQRAFIDKYMEKIFYRFPTFGAFYMHITKYFAWKVLGITWNPEIDSLLETQYAVVKLKERVSNISLNYSVGFKDMSHYFFPKSLTFNMATLKDGYMFPPCYSYPDTKYVSDGKKVEPPSDIGIGARTAGLYCHSTRFRVFFKGTYRIRVEGLPENVDNIQKVFSNISTLSWNPDTKTATIEAKSTMIPGDFGVATEEKNIPGLQFRVFYSD
ncbi:hypothetical protein L6255_03660 [Candidatus Parcubacteria bacterium]|nr:hypothetical protein [Patescibacteria group bacterium]MCG2689508.1 hypothetical protein [Candidatus Parcubacteria bacterium]